MRKQIPATEVQVGDLIGHKQFNMSRATVTSVTRVRCDHIMLTVNGAIVDLAKNLDLVTIATDQWVRAETYPADALIELMDQPEPKPAKVKRGAEKP